MADTPASSTATGPGAGVDAFLDALDHPHRRAIETLRLAILAADPRIAEEIKWNAPSYRLADHFLTFKLHPPKQVQLIFHVGAKPQRPARAFQLELPAQALKWAAPDRCVLTVSSLGEAEALVPRLGPAVRQWLTQLST